MNLAGYIGITPADRRTQTEPIRSKDMDLFTELTDNDAEKISGGGKNWGDTTSDAIADGFE